MKNYTAFSTTVIKFENEFNFITDTITSFSFKIFWENLAQKILN